MLINFTYMTPAQAALARRALNCGVHVDDYQSYTSEIYGRTRYPAIALYHDDGTLAYTIETYVGSLRGNRRNTYFYKWTTDGKKFEVSQAAISIWLTAQEKGSLS